MNKDYSGTEALPPAHQLDVAALRAYLAENLPLEPGSLDVRRFKGGQSNPTYLLDSGGQRYVLRRKPVGTLLPSAHAIEREYRVISALSDSAVPVPRPRLLCEDPSIIGSAFYVMDYVDGRVFWDAALPGLSSSERAAVYGELGRVIAELHKQPWMTPNLDGFGRPENYVARQIARWTAQYRASQHEDISSMERLIDWLPGHVPAGDETAIVHGDYKLDNVIFHQTEPRIVAVLDWELSTLGHPMVDFAYHCMAWMVPYERINGLAGLDLDALSIPSQQAYLEQYCAATGRAMPSAGEWLFYQAFCLFRIAAISQGIMARARKGNASNDSAFEFGSRARLYADLGWQLVESGSAGTTD
ncbi:phosphotransferase [Burkholderia multivorans]|uniref:phosphotransferase n=1 Tax=Burkholderia multivorans TaxID=87883 RepID=UPI0019D1D326|nr:phosphotransferase [Burkholderia multivorans]MBN6731260.1 phosphotransferase [Burkholderia multivorans]MBN6733470.1 phosphotransferase [Burkholderia multivorans]MBN7130392.1 phosphotransferase [Burkholderia multivorans]MBN8165074.1 phosphotransferase [Burkholderia multivorans]MBN8170863.1 phosphotransferase [Burkholderia multivorans]